jgi:hypothetical protein
MRMLSVVFVAVTPFASQAAPTYLGLYLQGHKIGYSSYATMSANFRGRRVERSDTHTVMDTGLLGTPLHIEIDSRTFLGKDSKPLHMDFDMESQGRRQTVRADFGEKSVTVLVVNSGVRSTRTLAMPIGPVVDDPMDLVLKGRSQVKCYVLDPSTVSFIPNEVRFIGKQKTQVGTRTVEATVIDIEDPRATTRVYLGRTGDVLRAEGPMGITMVPETAAEAMKAGGRYTPDVDLAYSTSIAPEGRLDDPADTTELKLGLSGRNLSSLPSDETQSVSRVGDGWTIDVHPPRFSAGSTISEAGAQQRAWTKPDLDMPSDSAKFRELGKQIIGNNSRVGDAALAIKKWVYEHMRPNAGIGVLRDASEILKTKEGVCRDYAVLTGTLLKSVGIPTRLASGLVDWDGTFYYHAWDEVWNGEGWIGVDSTTPDEQISAAHVKLADGTVAQAFTVAVLDKVKIRILGSHGK